MRTKNHDHKTTPQDESPDVSNKDLSTTASSAESKDNLDLVSVEQGQEGRKVTTPNKAMNQESSKTEGVDSKSPVEPEVPATQESSQATKESEQESSPPNLSQLKADLSQPAHDFAQPNFDVPQSDSDQSSQRQKYPFGSQSVYGLPPLPHNFHYESSSNDPSYKRNRAAQGQPQSSGFTPNAVPYMPQGQMGSFSQGQQGENFNRAHWSGPVIYGSQQGVFYQPNQPNQSFVQPYSNRPNYQPSMQWPQSLQGANNAPNAAPFSAPNFVSNPHGTASDLPFLVRSADGYIMMHSPQERSGQGAQPYSFNQGKNVENNPQSSYYNPQANCAMPQHLSHMQQGAADYNCWHRGQPSVGSAYFSGDYDGMPKIGNDEPSEQSAVPKTPLSGAGSLNGAHAQYQDSFSPSQGSEHTSNTNDAKDSNSTNNTNSSNDTNMANNISSDHNTNGLGGAGSGTTHNAGMWQVSGPSNLQARGYVSPAQPTEKWYDSLAAHIILVAIISLLLLIPTSFFSWVLSDRESNQNYAVDSMTAAWGGQQYLADPELIISVMEPSEIEVRGDNSRAPRGSLDHRFIRPKQAETVVNLVSEKRYKGNYEATLYTLEVVQSGYFDLEASMSLLESDSRITLISSDDIRIGFNVDDNKGLDEIKSIEINGRSYEPAPSDEFTGFEILVPKEHIGLDNRLKFKAHFLVRGSQVFKFYPLAQVSELKITAQGAVPNFAGSFLPREREVNAKELTFTANYYQNNLSTGQALVSSSVLTASQSHISIGLFDYADSYVLIDRLTKYVLLFIAMTYVTVLAFEIASKRLVSLVQYVVIGVALILFYLVLLSFSEHFSFVFSYIVAALTLSLMIALYMKAVFNSKKNAVCLFIMLLAMYAVLFAIVHIEAYALLVGTILLVIMLGVVMYITRHINQKPITRHYAEQDKA